MSTISIDVDYLLKLTEEQRIAFLRAFAKMAGVDGHFDDCERDFIYMAATDLGISSEKTDQILLNLDTETVVNDVKCIKDRRAALELVKQLCVLAHTDNVLSDEETLFIGEVGQAVGLELEKIEEISQWVIDYLVWFEQGKLIFEEI